MALKRKVKKPSRNGRTVSEPWIPDTTWRLADQRASLGRKIIANKGELSILTRRFQETLNEDSRSRVRRAEDDIESVVGGDQLREAWSKTQMCYREAKGHQAPPISEQLEQTSTLREDIYRRRPPEGGVYQS